jgi:putative ABC transport system ATP-binding protein
MSGPVIETVDVVKLLGKGAAQVQALRGVSLALQGGELTILMGPSGSGKTTLLSVLGCMLKPTSGTVRVDGRSTEGAGPEELAKLRRDHVGFIFQSYHLFPTLTAADNVRLALDVRGDNSAHAVAKAKDALALVGLAHKTDAYPLELSGGEQQRVAIARAIVGKPSAILADEPTAALDSQNGSAIMKLLAEIAKDPAHGVLVVAHDPRILQFADRIVHIEDGRIVGEERRGIDTKTGADAKADTKTGAGAKDGTDDKISTDGKKGDCETHGAAEKPDHVEK